MFDTISSSGVAAAAGVRVGDLALSIDNEPAAERSTFAGTDWQIYSPATHDSIELVTTGCDLGVDLWRTGEAMEARGDVSRRELEVLWKRGDWARLERLARLRVEAQRDDPALALLGGALVELGRASEGDAMAAEYARDFTSHWPMCYTAVALYYGGLAALRNGDDALGVQLLEVAYRHEAYERIGEALARVRGSRPTGGRGRWVDEKFPVQYTLPSIRGAEARVRLGAALAALVPGQVLLVALMAEQRTNGPYNDFMRRYRAFASDLQPFVRGLHVLTSARQWAVTRPELFAGEEAVTAAGLPFVLVEDVGTAVADALQPKGVPQIYVLDRDGRVLHEGMAESVDVWDALGRLDAGDDVRPRASALLALVRSSRAAWVALGALLIAGVLVVRACGTSTPGEEDTPGARELANLRATLERADLLFVPVRLETLTAAKRVRASGDALTETAVQPRYDVRPMNILTDAGTRAVELLVVRTREDDLPDGSGYRPMSPTQVLELATTMPRGGGLYLDAVIVGMAEVETLLAKLSKKRSVPFEIRQAGRATKRASK